MGSKQAPVYAVFIISEFILPIQYYPSAICAFIHLRQEHDCTAVCTVFSITNTLCFPALNRETDS